MSKVIDVPGKIDFHVAVDEDVHNVVLIMVGTNNSKQIRMLRAFDNFENIDLIIERLTKAKAEAEALRSKAETQRTVLKDARFIDHNVIDFIKWKQFAGIDLGPIGKDYDVDENSGAAQKPGGVSNSKNRNKGGKKSAGKGRRQAVEIEIDDSPDPVNDPGPRAA